MEQRWKGRERGDGREVAGRKGRKGSRREEGEEQRRVGRGEKGKKLIVNYLQLNAMYIHNRICTFHVVLGHVEEGGVELLHMDVS